MRKKNENGGVSVHAIAGAEVVLLGLNATKDAAKGLLGFSIYKRKGGKGSFKPLTGGKIFKGSTKKKGASDAFPIQAFMWSDYVVDPGIKYSYKVVPVYGTPEKLKSGKAVQVTITTENNDLGQQAIYFNRGVAGSQAYSKRFGKYRRWYLEKDFNDRLFLKDFVKPKDIPNRAAYKWLSRGLEEGMLKFISQANGPEYSIRASLYELTYEPVVQAFIDALDTGADVKVIHHDKQQNTYVVKRDSSSNVVVRINGVDKTRKGRVEQKSVSDSVGKAANNTIAGMGIKNEEYGEQFKSMFIRRTNTTISHNKYIILLKNDEPIQVWTGSTNITEGGIFGQSNVGHIVRDKKVAAKYFAFWKELLQDPKTKDIRKWNIDQQADLKGPPPPNSITPIFSPRPTKAMLDWYAERLDAAKNSVFFTAAFSVANEIFEKVTKVKKVKGPYLRYLLLEGIGGLIRKKYPDMKAVDQNRIAWGEISKKRKRKGEEHHELIETLTGLNDHVNFLHTKFMLIDPLTDDPIVITGSANFSEASTKSNDENMLIIRGNTRVADIFLGEFMRMFKHFESRNVRNKLTDEEEANRDFLASDDSWTKPYYQKGSPLKNERMLFG